VLHELEAELLLALVDLLEAVRALLLAAALVGLPAAALVDLHEAALVDLLAEVRVGPRVALPFVAAVLQGLVVAVVLAVLAVRRCEEELLEALVLLVASDVAARELVAAVVHLVVAAARSWRLHRARAVPPTRPPTPTTRTTRRFASRHGRWKSTSRASPSSRLRWHNSRRNSTSSNSTRTAAPPQPRVRPPATATTRREWLHSRRSWLRSRPRMRPRRARSRRSLGASLIPTSNLTRCSTAASCCRTEPTRPRYVSNATLPHLITQLLDHSLTLAVCVAGTTR